MVAANKASRAEPRMNARGSRSTPASFSVNSAIGGIAWPGIKAELDAGRLSPIGLIKIKTFDLTKMQKNHQVLAYGYELDEGAGALAVRVYDPNRPDDDEARIHVALGDGTAIPTFQYPGGVNVRAFFRTAYTPVDPR